MPVNHGAVSPGFCSARHDYRRNPHLPSGIRVVMFMLMLPVVGMAVFVHHALGETAAGYALVYALARVVLCVLFVRVGLHSRISRTISWSYAVSFIVVAGLVAASVLAPQARLALWSLALLIELVMPPAVSASVRRLLPHRRETSKLPERFGLFTIIALGETVVGVFQGLSSTRHPTGGSSPRAPSAWRCRSRSGPSTSISSRSATSGKASGGSSPGDMPTLCCLCASRRPAPRCRAW